jgi:hypothetical protein
MKGRILPGHDHAFFTDSAAKSDGENERPAGESEPAP